MANELRQLDNVIKFLSMAVASVPTFNGHGKSPDDVAVAQRHVLQWHLGKWNQRLKPG